MTAPRPPHLRTQVIAALRAYLAERLQLDPRLIGGWEKVPGNVPTLAVYSHEGEFVHKPGGLNATHDTVICTMHIRTPSVPFAENEVNAVGEGIAFALNTFRHPRVAGCVASGWSFDTHGTGPFDNVLTVRGKLSLRSGPGETSDDATGLAARVLLDHVRQESP